MPAKLLTTAQYPAAVRLGLCMRGPLGIIRRVEVLLYGRAPCDLAAPYIPGMQLCANRIDTHVQLGSQLLDMRFFQQIEMMTGDHFYLARG